MCECAVRGEGGRVGKCVSHILGEVAVPLKEGDNKRERECLSVCLYICKREGASQRQ